MTVFGDTNDMPSEIRKLHKEINQLRDQAEFQPILTTGRSDDGFGASVGSKTMNSQGVWSLTPVIHSVIDNPATSGTTYDMIELISACAVIDKNPLQGTSVTELDVKTITMGSINETGVDAKNSAPNGAILFIKPINGKEITLKVGGNIHISQDVTLDDKAFAILQFFVTADEVVTPPADGSNPFPEENKKWVLLTGDGSINAIKEPCRCATTGNNILPLSIGSTVDGTTIVVNDRVLYKNQLDNTQSVGSKTKDNGIYVCTNITGIVAIMKRASDFDNDSEVKSGTIVTVNEGTANGNKLFMMTNDVDITVGTTDITFTLVTSVDTSLDYVWTGVHKFQNALTELGVGGTDVIKVIGEINGVGPWTNMQNPDGSGNNDYTIPSNSAGMNVDTSIIMNTHNIYDVDQILFARGASSLIPTWEDDHIGFEFTQASDGTDTGLGYHVANNNSTTQYHRFFVNAHYDSEEELRIGADGIKFGTNTTPTGNGSIFFDGTNLKVITGGATINLTNATGGVQLDDDPVWTGKHVWDNDETWLETWTTDSVKDSHTHAKFQGDGLSHDDYDYTDYDSNPTQRVATFGKYGEHEVQFIAQIIGKGEAVIVDPASNDGTSEFTIPNSDPSISIKSAIVMNTFSIYDLDQIVFGQGPSSTSPPMLNNWVGVQANTGEDTSTNGNNPPNPVLNGMSLHVPDNKEFFFKVGKGTAGEEATGSNVTEIFRVSENGIKIAGSSVPSSLANGMIWHNSSDNKVYARSNGVSVELGSGSGGGGVALGDTPTWTGNHIFEEDVTIKVSDKRSYRKYIRCGKYC